MTVPTTYGTAAAGSERARSTPCFNRRDQETPLLGRSGHFSRWARWRAEMLEDISLSWTDAVLMMCYFVTGLLDSSAIQVWGTFVSMQTGNSVYVGLGLASLLVAQPTDRLIKSSVSILSFCVGSFFFGRFHTAFSPKRRWVLCVSFALQALLTAAAAALVSTWPPSVAASAISWNILLPISIIAFQSCGQAVTSRAVQHTALSSVVLTGIYCDLFADQELFAFKNVERNRRVAAPLSLILGAVIGGLFAHSQTGIAGGLWTAVVVKLLMAVAWYLWPAEDEYEE